MKSSLITLSKNDLLEINGGDAESKGTGYFIGKAIGILIRYSI